MPAPEELHSVVCLLERRVQELRDNGSPARTQSGGGSVPPAPESANSARSREAIFRLYEEAMHAARFDLSLMRG